MAWIRRQLESHSLDAPQMQRHCRRGGNALGYEPKPEDIDVEELNITPETLEKLLRVDKDAWKHEIQDIENFYSKFEQLPKELTDSLEELKQGIDKL